MYNKLPNEIPNHWDINGNVTYAEKVSFGLLLHFQLLWQHYLCFYQKLTREKEL